MSAEDLPEAVNSENMDEGSREVVKGIILITDEGDEVESKAKVEEPDDKYVMHEVLVEIEPCNDDDDMKPDITWIDEDAAPEVLSYEVADVNIMDVCSNEIIIPNDTEPQDIHIVDTIIVENQEKLVNENNNIESQKNCIADTTNVDKPIQEKPASENNNIETQKNHITDTKDVKKASQKKSAYENNVSKDNIKPQDIHLAESMKIDKVIQEKALLDQMDTFCDPGLTTTAIEEGVMPTIGQRAKVQLYTEDTGPQMYRAKGALVTAPIITKNLPKVFDYLPIHGKPQDGNNLKEFFAGKIREFVGCGLTDYEFQQLEEYCSPEQLKTGNEVVMETNVPVMGVIIGKNAENNDSPENGASPDLCILKKNQLRIEKDTKGLFTKKLKYRGVRSLPFTQVDYHQMPPLKPSEESPDLDLEPGRDILYRVRVYRPYIYSQSKDRFTRTRHSVFCCDIMLTGRNKLSDLRDRFVCHNDFDMRVDVSNHPDMMPSTKAKEVFPSGFLFINNVFYVDTREGCVDYSAPIRDWARKKDMGVFPKKDMCAVRLEELTLKLGYPEVYVHQGHCEHVFLFSEVRLLSPTDPLRLYNYPCSTAVAQNQTVYCTTCAEYPAKWIVVGCSRVPFDPAFFCEVCFRQYLYIDGQKIGDFKAYSYRGNALNLLKPQ